MEDRVLLNLGSSIEIADAARQDGIVRSRERFITIGSRATHPEHELMSFVFRSSRACQTEWSFGWWRSRAAWNEHSGPLFAAVKDACLSFRCFMRMLFKVHWLLVVLLSSVGSRVGDAILNVWICEGKKMFARYCIDCDKSTIDIDNSWI